MNHYKNYSTEDFVQDLRFRSWVRAPSPDEDEIWRSWIGENPHKSEIVEEARGIVLAIHPVDAELITDKEIENEIHHILTRLDKIDQGDNKDMDAREEKKLSFPRWLKFAASITVVAITGWYTVEFARKSVVDEPDRSALSAENYMIEHVNKSDDALLINLPDSSSVLLSGNSLIRYPKQFSGATRNVSLKGTAFFEVTKDASRPFFVDAGPILAKVLGTSFEINTHPGDGEVRVIVKSGKVSIYSNREQDLRDRHDPPNVILTEHEQFLLKDDKAQLQHTRLQPVDIKQLRVPDTYMKFTATPVAEVFRALASVYGVKINFENAGIKECSVTASFTDEPFALKLHLICRSIGLTYEMANDEVTISGEGCRN